MTKIRKSPFGVFEGREVDKYTMTEGDISVSVLTYGGILQSIVILDKNGVKRDVLLGYDDLDGYLNNGGYLGALIGRFGNRIEKGNLTIDGVTYELYRNDRGNHLHGGKIGFNAKIWKAETLNGTLELSYFSPDGEENYPGNLTVKVVYSLKDGALNISYFAVSDKKTAIAMTNHAYFNLNGEGNEETAADNILQIDAPYITPTDDTLIPHGEFRAVAGTPFDFNEPKAIESDVEADDPDLKKGGGYDHCFVFDKNRDAKKPYAVAYSEKTGIEMKCYTDMPAVQLYTGNGLDQYGKGGHHYGKRNAYCLETEAIPNNVNVPAYAEYGSSIYDRGEAYRFFATYAFSVKK